MQTRIRYLSTATETIYKWENNFENSITSLQQAINKSSDKNVIREISTLCSCVVFAAVSAVDIPWTGTDYHEDVSVTFYPLNTKAIETHNLTNGNSFHIGFPHPGSIVAQS